jgi:hypothetical protein
MRLISWTLRSGSEHSGIYINAVISVVFYKLTMILSDVVLYKVYLILAQELVGTA